MNQYFFDAKPGRQQVTTIDLIKTRGFSSQNIPWCPLPTEGDEPYQLELGGHAIRLSPVQGLAIRIGCFPEVDVSYDAPCGQLIVQAEMFGQPFIRAISPWSAMETLRRLGAVRPGARRARLDNLVGTTVSMWGSSGIGCPGAIAALAAFHMRTINGDHRLIDGWTAEHWGWPKFTTDGKPPGLPQRLWDPKDPEVRSPIMAVGRLLYFHYEALLRVGIYVGGMRQMEQFGIGLAELMGGERGLLGRVFAGGDDETELFVMTANGHPLVVLLNPYEALRAANARMSMAETLPVERKDDEFDTVPATVRSVYRLLDRPSRILVPNTPGARLLATAVARDLVGADPGSHVGFFPIRIIPSVGDGLEASTSWFHTYVNEWISRWSRDGG